MKPFLLGLTLGIFLGVNLALYSVWWQSGAGE